MSSTSVPGVIADAAGLVREASAGQRGALWRLAEPGRQLDAQVVRLEPGAEVAKPVEPEADVLLCVFAGRGRLLTDAAEQDLVPGGIAWLPQGSHRALEAGSEGLVYLAAHRRRTGLTVAPAAVAPAAVEREGGEAACLLSLVCPECGRLAQESGARFCSRCGERLPAE
ncbi:hypothetical protein AB0M87_13655 [Streptomyces sp. NPDC051320]|uniref:hypothetical protein n=1 Tax=Streptomyces sp. NPDC051320 TaxID=3154644 RepID=UPI003426D45D